MSLFEASNLRKSYAGVHALDGVSISVDARECVALIGPNGAGKSTFFNVVDGQTSADGGEVRFEGRAVTGLSASELFHRGIGRTFQVARVFVSMTVLQNVQTALLAAARRLDVWRDANHLEQDEALALLDLVGVSRHAGKIAGTLAYGDIKRLELALALAHRPRLLLMDEPGAGLGAQDRHHLMALVTGLVASEGMGVLFTEHSMDVVFGHAQRIVVLARGRVIAQGSPDEISADPQVREVYLGSLRLDAYRVSRGVS